MRSEATVQKKVRLEDARAQLGLRQIDLSDLSGISVPVIRNAENGQRIRRLSAYAILDALNTKRAEKHLSALEYDEIEWEWEE